MERPHNYQPAIAKLKSDEYNPLSIAFGQYFADKGFDSHILNLYGSRYHDLTVAPAFAFSMANLYHRELLPESSGMYSFGPGDSYTGTPGENHVIDSRFHRTGIRDVGIGTAQEAYDFSPDSVYDNPAIRNTPIVVIGAGASGIMAARTARILGFSNIILLDQRGTSGGIWNDSRVKDGSKNNPFPIGFGRVRLPAAPGPGSDITDFINKVYSNFHPSGILPNPIRAKVLGISPGDLKHTIYVRIDSREHVITAPLVIYAGGIGQPLPLSDPKRMLTSATEHMSGNRWQEQLTPERLTQLAQETSPTKPLILIGLGNSTAEMLTQIYDYNTRHSGKKIIFRVLTHYPIKAIYEPERTIYESGRHVKVYRSIDAHNLVKLAGDLEPINTAYKYALAIDSVVADVARWDISEGKIRVQTKTGETQEWEYDPRLLYTLIGYGHREATLKAMGLVDSITDPSRGEITYDWDGELQREPGALGRNRVFPGYFGLGPILKRPENPNAPVIPGIMFRLPDLMTTLVMRAAESTIPGRSMPADSIDQLNAFVQSLRAQR